MTPKPERFARAVIPCEQGAAAVEYALLAALIAGVITGVVFTLGQSVLALFQTVVPGF